MKYTLIIHKDDNTDYGVTIPDLPGCFSAGSSLEEAIENAEEAILTHIEGLLIDNEDIPEPKTIEVYKEANSDKNIIWAVTNVDLAKLSGKAKRINVTIPERVLSKIDNYVYKEGETRSGFLVSAAMEYIHNHL
ncbi:MAG: type II toxin-antitoxin system HicB family antitoxin [Spirochaetes bacterium]|nr:type II toxin-antitoxin system HicB family antitoxin [Spirochaetota bacterium]